MYYRDLSPCDYFEPSLTKCLRAVGWLERGHSYEHGHPGDRTVQALSALLLNAWQGVYLFAGFHQCSLCHDKPFRSFRNLFVPHSDVVYVAPEAVVHYITEHEYLPPEVFCEAVVCCPTMGSSGYFEALVRSGFPKRRIGRACL